ncbi:type II toxin-antitoxin system HipA family toxin [Marinomonas profundi]|nr:type II toxin-antitoxin system HipA family toxin [Marinomonas profundi]
MSELDVYVGAQSVACLTKESDEFLLNYACDDSLSFVSLTMPVRAKSYVSNRLFPIFEMHLPEGYLLSVLKKHFSKLTATDDFGLLALLAGKVQGRLSYGANLGDGEFFSLDEVLQSSQPDLFAQLVGRFALSSPVSGVQPKVLALLKDKATLRMGHYIVKSWGDDYPDLALNEWLCMTALSKAGLDVPEFYLSDDERCFVMKRFDVTDSGYLGFEDFCVLQARSRDDKYVGSYEQLAKSIATFVSPRYRNKALLDYFKAIVLNQWLQNGDAHLKNFGVLYSSIEDIRLAPIYDVVSTTVYISQDIQALTLLGSKRWRSVAHLERFAVAHCGLTLKQARSAVAECLAGMVWLQYEVKLLQKQTTGKDSRGRLLDHFAGLAEKVLGYVGE